MTMLALLLALFLADNQPPTIQRVDPPHWWAHLGVDTLELLVEGNLQGQAFASRVTVFKHFGTQQLQMHATGI